MRHRLVKPTITPRNTAVVGMGHIAITHADAVKHCIATFGATTCVIVAIRNPHNQTAALSHIDATNDLRQMIDLMVSEVQKGQTGNAQELKIYLASEQIKHANHYVAENIKKILKEKNLTVMEEITNASLAVNAKDGRILRLNDKDARLFPFNGIDIIRDLNMSIDIPAEINFDGRPISPKQQKVIDLLYNAKSEAKPIISALNQLKPEQRITLLRRKDSGGYTVLHLAAEHFQADQLVPALLKDLDPSNKNHQHLVNCQTNSQLTAFHIISRSKPATSAAYDTLLKAGGEIKRSWLQYLALQCCGSGRRR